MPLTAQQLRQFAEEGYLFLPGCFSEEEVAVLRDEAEQIYATNRQEVWREKTGGPSPMEEDMLDFGYDVRPNSRLSCQIKVTDELDGLVVRVPERQA